MGKFEDALKARRQNLPLVDIGGIKCMVKPASQKTQSDALLAAVEYYQNNLPRQEMDGTPYVPVDEQDAAAIEDINKTGFVNVKTKRDIRIWLSAVTNIKKFRAIISLLDSYGRLAAVDAADITNLLSIIEADEESKEWEDFDAIPDQSKEVSEGQKLTNPPLLDEIQKLARWPEWDAKQPGSV